MKIHQSNFLHSSYNITSQNSDQIGISTEDKLNRNIFYRIFWNNLASIGLDLYNLKIKRIVVIKNGVNWNNNIFSYIARIFWILRIIICNVWHYG